MATTEKKNKKKISAATLIVAALIVVIIVNAVVWNNRLAKNSEISLLTGEIARISREIRTLQEPAGDLQARLAEVQAALAAAQKGIPAQFNRNDAFDYIINLSRECKVEVLPISSQGWVTEKTTKSYVILKLNATAIGSFAQVNDFIYKLQHNKYETLLTPEISITRQSAPNSSGKFSADNTTVVATMSISVYARPEAAKGN